MYVYIILLYNSIVLSSEAFDMGFLGLLLLKGVGVGNSIESPT